MSGSYTINDSAEFFTKQTLPVRRYFKQAFNVSMNRKDVKRNETQDEIKNRPQNSCTGRDQNMSEVRDESEWSDGRDDIETCSEEKTILHQDVRTLGEVANDGTQYAYISDYALYPLVLPTSEKIQRYRTKQSHYVPKDIWEACKIGNSFAVRRFIMEDPFLAVHPSDNDRTPLFLAAHGGHLETCEILLDNGANDPNGECTLGSLNDKIAKLIHFRGLQSLRSSQLEILTVDDEDESECQDEKVEKNNWWYKRIGQVVLL